MRATKHRSCGNCAHLIPITEVWGLCGVNKWASGDCEQVCLTDSCPKHDANEQPCWCDICLEERRNDAS
jgi:hypothetical protein